jgi:ubiquinone/menaquinone biosynthesis C-methylase UbiE
MMAVNWHKRFIQQAAWTQELRDYLYDRAGLTQAGIVLEVGCGTGVLLAEIIQRGQTMPVGVDLDFARLKSSSMNAPGSVLVQANGHDLPFKSASFGMAVCHFLLFWVGDPARVVAEMRRVVRRGGSVLALAEPDYGGRIDYPASLSVLGKWQQESLSDQGADPLIGRKLKGIFHQAGLKEVESGVLGAQWAGTPSKEELDLEWAVLEADLEGKVFKNTLENIRSQEMDAWERGERVLFVPTFYAWGHV